MKLEVKNLKLKYPSGALALSGIDFETEKVIAVVGPSMAGKTSLLRALAGLENCSGEIALDGENIANIPPKMRDIQLFFENFDVFENKTVFSNLAFPLKIRGEKAADIMEKVNSAARQFGLYEVLEFKAKRLNTDQKRAVALARLFLRDAKLTLLDNPLSKFSHKAASEVFPKLKQAVKSKSGVVVYATDDIFEAFEIAPQAVFLNFGQFKQQGTANELYFKPDFVVVADAFGDYNKVLSTLETEDGKLYVRLFGKKVFLPFDENKLISPSYVGKEILCGFHYGDVSVKTETATENENNLLEITEILQKCGGFILKIETDKGQIIARSNVEASGKVSLSVAPDRINLFDVSSEGNIVNR